MYFTPTSLDSDYVRTSWHYSVQKYIEDPTLYVKGPRAGMVAQLVERLPIKQGLVSSNPT